jgi:hypothetical protein
MSDCVDCENGECEEVISSSDILFNGGFVNVTIDPDATINEVLLQMETYFNSLVINVSDPVFILGENCLDMAEGTYSFQEIIQGVVDKLCEVATTAETGVTTNDVTLEDITLPDCLSTFTGTTSTELFDFIMSVLCGVVSLFPPEPIVDPPVSGTGVTRTRKDEPAQLVNNYIVEQYHLSLAENDTYVFEHDTPLYNGLALNVTVQPIKAVIENSLVTRAGEEILGLTATKDNYVLLFDDGDLANSFVNIGDPQPAMPPGKGGIFLYKATTDATGVTALVNLFDTSAFNDPTFTIDPDTIETAMIQDAAITTVKIANVGIDATKGHVSILQIEVNKQGQVLDVNSNIDLSGIADGDILTYDAGIGGFIVGQKRALTPSTFFPVSDGSDYATSSIKETTQIEVLKNIEVNAGIVENDVNAILNLVSTTEYFKPPVMTAAQASLISPTDGAMLYVTTTDATFTSIGFWGYENSVWVKL